jgi:hypothetical protein
MRNSKYLLVLGYVLTLDWLILGMFNDDFPTTLVIVSNDGMTVNDALERICKEDGMAYFNFTAPGFQPQQSAHLSLSAR